MYRILIATDDGVRTVRWNGSEPDGQAGSREPLPVTSALTGLRLRAVLEHPDTGYYAGTLEHGLWRERDDGKWAPVQGFPRTLSVTSLAVGPPDPESARAVFWVGTEPSRIYRSTDGGRSWERRGDLTRLPSAGEWSYPPRPDTHHVRTLAPHPRNPDALLAGIEAGAVIRTLDGGNSWEDRTPEGPRDPHRIVVDPRHGRRVLVAAGDGFRESPNFGERWIASGDGMGSDYVWDVAVDSSAQGPVLAVAAPDAGRAHGRSSPASRLYRRAGDSAEFDERSREAWDEVKPGPPGLDEMRVPSIDAVPGAAGTFILCSQEGDLFVTLDGGDAWAQLPLASGGMEGVGGVMAVRVTDRSPPFRSKALRGGVPPRRSLHP